MSDERKLSRRDFLWLSGATAAGALLAACQPATPAPTQAPAGATAAPAAEATEAPAAEPTEAPVEVPAAKDNVEISWWSFGIGFPADEWPHGKWEGERADEYSAMDNGVTIEYQALGWDMLTKWSTAVAAGTPPEIVLRASHTNVKEAIDAGLAAEVTLEDDLLNDLAPGFYDAILFHGKNYLIPFYNMAQGSLLNMDLVTEAGVEDMVPGINGNDEKWAMDEWLALAKELTFERDDGTPTYGYAIPTTASNPYVLWPIWLMMWNYGADTLKHDASKGWECAMAD